MTMSLAACSFDLEPLVPCFRNSAFAEDIDVVEAGEVVIDDRDMSSSFRSWAPGKAFAFGRIACPLRSSLAPLGQRLCEILSKMAMAIAPLQNIGEGKVEDADRDPLPKC